ncbi:hypothetical protein HK405_009241, partial [Cladochytrium tenue]
MHVAGAVAAVAAAVAVASSVAVAAPTPFAAPGCPSNSSAGAGSSGLDSVNVQLDYVDLVGTKLNGTTFGTPLRAFLGIPYAQPPLGELRFAPPQAISSHLGTVTATSFGHNCMQNKTPFTVIPYGEPDLAISEDCLFINVWTPTAVQESPLPVMVW